MKESDLYEPVKDLFEDKGYDVYAEVTVRYCRGRIDVVAAAPPAYTAIELKTSLSIDLIGQAMERKAVFPLVYIAIPLPKRNKEFPRWLLRFLDAEGIGIIGVNGPYTRIIRNAKWRKPLMGRKVDLSEILREEHKTWAVGGTDGGGYVTPYRLTMVGVKHYLANARKEDRPFPPPDGDFGLADISIETENGIIVRFNNEEVEPGFYDYENVGWRSMNQILEHCETHYATPRSSLAKALMEFEDWVEMKKIGRTSYFRIKEGAK